MELNGVDSEHEKSKKMGR